MLSLLESHFWAQWKSKLAKKTVTIHQPQYLPWIPFFDKIIRSDHFILLDNVQFQKNGIQNRNKIKSMNGAQWLTVPVRHHFGQLISDTQIADSRSLRKHLQTLDQFYKKAKHFEEVRSLIAPVLSRDYEKLSNLTSELIDCILKYLSYDGQVTKASTLCATGVGSELIFNICREVHADAYVSGAGGRAYMQVEEFVSNGIEVVFQEYRNVQYPQLFQDIGFVPDLSIVDLMFNVGCESRKIIELGRIK